MNQAPAPRGCHFLRWWPAVAFFGLLAACGGGSSADVVDAKVGSFTRSGINEGPPNASQAEFARSAELSSAELAAAEDRAQAADGYPTPTALNDLKTGQIAAKSAYLSGAVARKALAVRIPVYRFSNSSTGAHFFTTSTTERDNVVNTLSPPFSLEGEAFSVASAYSPGLSPVHRFYNTQTGVHFYTISEAERANVVATLPHFSYEGVAYHASQVAGAGLIPFYRFYVPGKGFHFYTANEAEKDNIVANLSATYSFEGVGYHVLASDWRAEKLPHTGINSSQCFEAGSNTLVNCNGFLATDFNPEQDGHRANINPMSYSAVGGRPLSICVRDNVTGLVWEGKDATGTRAGSNTYTNLDNGLASDASGYVVAANTANLCGFNDWRLPSIRELSNIVDHSRGTAPKINTAWFPNTVANNYWSAELESTNNANAWYVDFQYGYVYFEARSAVRAVRLVRGYSPSGSRFTYSTVAYGTDGAGNVVNDAWTGLQWRRCEEGRVWSGSACTGTSGTVYTHEQALAHARSQSGWRLPNIKELSSLADLSVSSGPRIHATAFPGASGTTTWSSSPSVENPSLAWAFWLASGDVYSTPRSYFYAVRLVRASP